jgi:hypothetical protein
VCITGIGTATLQDLSERIPTFDTHYRDTSAFQQGQCIFVGRFVLERGCVESDDGYLHAPALEMTHSLVPIA